LQWFETIYPYNAPALNMLGAAYMMRGNWPKAEHYFRKAIEVYPDFKMARQNLERVQLLQRIQRARAGRPVHPAPAPTAR